MYKLFLSDCVIAYEEKLRMTKSKKNKNKPKLNLTVREEQRNKLEQMASLEKRSQQTARNCAEQFSILSPGEKCQSKNGLVEILSFSF